MGARIVALFGAPNAGKTTIARILASASNKLVAVVGMDDVELAAAGAEVVFVDALRSVDDIKQLWDARLLDAMNGCAVQVVNHQLAGVSAEWQTTRAQIEEAIFTYSIPYRTIVNVLGDIEAPIAELARIAQLKS